MKQKMQVQVKQKMLGLKQHEMAKASSLLSFVGEGQGARSLSHGYQQNHISGIERIYNLLHRAVIVKGV